MNEAYTGHDTTWYYKNRVTIMIKNQGYKIVGYSLICPITHPLTNKQHQNKRSHTFGGIRMGYPLSNTVTFLPLVWIWH